MRPERFVADEFDNLAALNSPEPLRFVVWLATLVWTQNLADLNDAAKPLKHILISGTHLHAQVQARLRGSGVLEAE